MVIEVVRDDVIDHAAEEFVAIFERATETF